MNQPIDCAQRISIGVAAIRIAVIRIIVDRVPIAVVRMVRVAGVEAAVSVVVSQSNTQMDARVAEVRAAKMADV